MRKYFSEFNGKKMLTYGVNIYQVWSYETREEIGNYKLEYETSSKAKAGAVSEYLNAKSDQDNADQYRTPDIQGTIVPSTIKV